MATVKFYNVSQTQYETAVLNATLEEGALYYTTDTRRIYRANGTTTATVYSRPVVLVDTGGTPPVDFPTSGEQGTIYIDMATAEKRIYAGDAWVVIDRPVVTSLTGSATDDQIPTAKAVYDLILAQSVTATHAPVQDLTALIAITDMVDKQLIWVEDAASIYAYDEQSTTTVSSPDVIEPTSGTGRWVKLSSATNYTAGDGVTISGQTLALNANATEFTFDTTTHELQVGAIGMAKITNLSTTLAGKMGAVTSPTAGNLISQTAGGDAADAGVKAGGATLAGTPDATTLATEAAVQTAIQNALTWN